MKLKTWQKWGIVFGILHILLLLLVLLYAYSTKYWETLYLLPIIDAPVIYIWGRLLPNRFIKEEYLLLYLLIMGTLFYSAIGVLLGFSIHRIKKVLT